MASDTFIAIDGGAFHRQYLFTYDGALYDLIPDQSNFSTPTPIKMYKSTDGGLTWAALTSVLNAGAFFSVSGGICLIGTKLYVWYVPSGGFVTGLGFFDFTADTFTAVATSGNTGVFTAPFLAGTDPAQIYTLNGGAIGGVAIGQYVANVFSVIGTMNNIAPYTASAPEIFLRGSSGILHVFYLAAKTGSGPSDLGYANVVTGTLNGTIGSTIVFPSYGDAGSGSSGGFTSQPVQIGTNIYFSFYDVTAQQLKLIIFPDVATPAFAVSVIDPALTIAIPSGFKSQPTGAWTNVLAYFGTTLYCFYTNASPNGVGDGNLYYSSSTNAGATWSARKTATQHLDPVDNTASSIWFPQTVQVVGTPTKLASAEISYRQVNPDSLFQYQSGRFAFPFKLSVTRNFVRS